MEFSSLSRTLSPPRVYTRFFSFLAYNILGEIFLPFVVLLPERHNIVSKFVFHFIVLIPPPKRQRSQRKDVSPGNIKITVNSFALAM